MGFSIFGLNETCFNEGKKIENGWNSQD